MHFSKPLILVAALYIAGGSAAAVNSLLGTRDGQASNVCKVDGEHCDSDVDCCGSFDCETLTVSGVGTIATPICGCGMLIHVPCLCYRITNVVPAHFAGPSPA